MFLLKHFKWDNLLYILMQKVQLFGKLIKNKKTFLYYALTVRHPNAIISSIPLAEMLSSDHTNVEISHFLNKWLYTTKKVFSKAFSQAHIEIDYSWAMLHSICYSFNQESLGKYPSNCLQMNTTQDIVNTHNKAIMHRCVGATFRAWRPWPPWPPWFLRL